MKISVKLPIWKYLWYLKLANEFIASWSNANSTDSLCLGMGRMGSTLKKNMVYYFITIRIFLIKMCAHSKPKPIHNIMFSVLIFASHSSVGPSVFSSMEWSRAFLYEHFSKGFPYGHVNEREWIQEVVRGMYKWGNQHSFSAFFGAFNQTHLYINVYCRNYVNNFVSISTFIFICKTCT